MTDASTPRTLVLLRHGRSRADDEEVMEGRYDSPLTDVGRSQVNLLGRHWSRTGVTYDRIVCSSLVRAREAAEIIGGRLGVEPEVSDLWMEFDNGPLAGLAYADAAARYPAPAFRSRWTPLTPDGGESIAAVHRRASLALETLLNGPGDRLLVVAHGTILNAALRVLMGASTATYFEFEDTGYAILLLPRSSDGVVLRYFGPSPALG